MFLSYLLDFSSLQYLIGEGWVYHLFIYLFISAGAIDW